MAHEILVTLFSGSGPAGSNYLFFKSPAFTLTNFLQEVVNMRHRIAIYDGVVVVSPADEEVDVLPPSVGIRCSKPPNIPATLSKFS